MSAPVLQDVLDYLAAVDVPTAYSNEQIEAALEAEQASQAARCRVPDAAAVWPADLSEALCRRVAHNLALRSLPLGIQANVSEAAVAQTRVGGSDAEVRRLEAPWRRIVVG